MNRGVGDTAVAGAFTIAGFAVVVAPALAMRSGVLADGVGSLDDDIVAASVIVGVVHAALAWYRLRGQRSGARSASQDWIAALNALVVLGLSASLLLLVVLLAFPDEHLTLGHRGFPVVAMWAGLQVVAVLLAEATAQLTSRWLEAGPAQAAR